MTFWQSLHKPFFALAPMEDVTDDIFRQVVAHAARPDVFFTEFVNTASYFSEKGRPNAAKRLAIVESDKPIIAQIWGTVPEHYEFIAHDIAKMGYAGIDINMGCPVKDVVKTGGCSALIDNPELAAKLIAAAKKGGLPVSVKTRIGTKTVKTEEWISFLLQQDLAALTVHGRTAKQMSKVPADWGEIAKAVELRNKIAPQTVIIGNGDVADRKDGLQKADQTGVDGIMIGRGVFTNPYCFETEPKEHTSEELIELLNYHLNLFEPKRGGDYKSFPTLKRFFKVYIRGWDGAQELRTKLMGTKNLDEAKAIISNSY
jgi:tRNA-dihydrouridine synthase